MNKFSGFTLIELLISTLISGILLTVLFISLNQINRTKKSLDNSIRKSNRVSLVHYLTERDLMGAFVPVVPEVPEEPKEEKKDEPSKPGEQKKPEEPKKEEKKEEKKTKPKFDKIFFSENKGANAQTLTFISNNPLPVYWSKKAGKPQPKMVRIVYRLQPDPARRNSFKLMRQEGDDLSYEAYDPKIPIDKQKYRPFEVIDGIKGFSTLYYYVPIKKPQATKPGEKKEEPKIEYKTAKEWGKLKPEEQEKAGIPQLPRYVELTLVLWDNTYQRDSTWKFTIPILPPSAPVAVKSATPAQQQPQKPENKPAQPGTASGTSMTPTAPQPSFASPIKATTFNMPQGFKAGIPEGVHVGPRWQNLPTSPINRFNMLPHNGNS